MPYTYVNRATALLGATLSDSATSIAVETGKGALFAGASVASPIRCKIVEGTTVEIVDVTARSADTLTLVRGVEAPDGSTAAAGTAFTAAARITATVTGEMFEDMQRLWRDAVPIIWNAGGLADTVVYSSGGAAPSGDGTATARTLATTNFYTHQRRVSRVSSASSGQTSGWNGTAVFTRGSVAGSGGFLIVTEWGIGDAASVANARMFVGLSANAINNAEPTSILNTVGFGCDAGDTTLRVIHNDGSGTATEVDLGANFPMDTQSTDWYRTELFARPNASEIWYRVTRRNTGHVATGVLTTKLPVNTAFMFFNLRRNNGSTAAAVGPDLGFTRMFVGLPTNG